MQSTVNFAWILELNVAKFVLRGAVNRSLDISVTVKWTWIFSNGDSLRKLEIAGVVHVWRWISEWTGALYCMWFIQIEWIWDPYIFIRSSRGKTYEVWNSQNVSALPQWIQPTTICMLCEFVTILSQSPQSLHPLEFRIVGTMDGVTRFTESPERLAQTVTS